MDALIKRLHALEKDYDVLLRKDDFKGNKKTLDEMYSEMQDLRDQIQRMKDFEAYKNEPEVRKPKTLEDTADVQARGIDDYKNPGEEPIYLSLGEQMVDICRVGVLRDHAAEKRLQRFNERIIKKRAASGHNIATPSEGGFLVGTQTARTLKDSIFETSILGNKCTRQPIGAGFTSYSETVLDETSRVDGSRQGGILVYRRDEADTVTSTKTKLRENKVELTSLMGLTYFTEETMQDATALNGFVKRSFGKEFGFRMDQEILVGTGGQQMVGIIGGPSIVTVDKESNQVATTIIYENVVNMFARMIPSLLGGAEWYINQNIWPQLMSLNLAVGTGGQAVFVAGGNIAGAPYGTIFGRPIVALEQCKTLGTEGDIIFANFSDYLIVDRDDVQTAESIHIRFDYAETALRFIYRVNGQPSTNSAITPNQGSSTISPYISLQTRS
jgi:HK97 family phage major capsid protein